MPDLARWYFKTSLVYLIAGLLIGVVLSIGGPLGGLLAGMTPVYYHVLVVGWITQLILGVAIWMFPKYTLEQPRGNETMAWGAYLLLNLGLVLRVIAEPLNIPGPTNIWGALLVASAVFQLLAGGLIVGNLWRRVKEK